MRCLHIRQTSIFLFHAANAAKREGAKRIRAARRGGSGFELPGIGAEDCPAWKRLLIRGFLFSPVVLDYLR